METKVQNQNLKTENQNKNNLIDIKYTKNNMMNNGKAWSTL